MQKVQQISDYIMYGEVYMYLVHQISAYEAEMGQMLRISCTIYSILDEIAVINKISCTFCIKLRTKVTESLY